MKTDIEIAQEARMKPITQIAAQLGLEEESVIPYGRYKAKIDHRLIHNAKKQGKLILVTAISPTPAGEGKTTTSVGLADAMNALGAIPPSAVPPRDIWCGKSMPWAVKWEKILTRPLSSPKCLTVPKDLQCTPYVRRLTNRHTAMK